MIIRPSGHYCNDETQPARAAHSHKLPPQEPWEGALGLGEGSTCASSHHL